jgi:glycosidase
VDFWEQVRRELDQLKPVLMLAEWESRDLHARAFDITYAWSWNETMHRISKGEADVDAMRIYYAWNEGSYPAGAIRMTFVSNHDHNAWEGTEYEKFGAALEAAIVLSMTGHGMPLIYNGQEAGSDKRLPLFERSPIEWRDHPMGDFYARLIQLKRSNSALWNAPWGAPMLNVPNTAPSRVLSFVRRNNEARLFVVLNLSAAPASVGLRETLFHGRWRDFFADSDVELAAGATMDLPAWGYRVLVGSP